MSSVTFCAFYKLLTFSGNSQIIGPNLTFQKECFATFFVPEHHLIISLIQQ